MKHTFFVIMLCLLPLTAAAQQADQRAATLINQADWFTLNDEFPSLRDSMQYDFLRLMAESMLNYHFGRDTKAVANIAELLNHHQEELGTATSLSMNYLRLSILGRMGQYAEAADGAKSVIDQLAGLGADKLLVPAIHLYNTYAPMRAYPAPQLVRSAQDVVVPFNRVIVNDVKREDWMRTGKIQRRDSLLSIPVAIHGKTYPFIFDTGASQTMIALRKVQELGLPILTDTLTIGSADGQEKICSYAFIDSLSVGGITYRNMMALVGTDTTLAHHTQKLDFILGVDFISAVGEVQIDMDKREMLFPAKPTPRPATGSNIYLDHVPYLRASKDGIPLLFCFDTGCAGATLSSNYYQKFSDEVKATATPDTINTMGYGTIGTHEVLYLPSVSFAINDTPVTIREIHLDPTATDNTDGRMGTALLRLFRRITINMQDMFVEF